MRKLPKTNDSLLVRTDFSDDGAWTALRAHVAQANDEGFRAYVVYVDDPHFANWEWSALKSAVPRNRERASVLFVADSEALGRLDHPILVVDLDANRTPFRCIADALCSVENNLNISNMGWEEFSEATSEGIYRGFAR